VLEGGSVLQKQTAEGILLAILALSLLTVEITNILPGFIPDEEWNKTYTYNGQDSCHALSVRQTLDGGYVVAGEVWSHGGGYDWYRMLLVKVDPNGNMQWNRTFPAETNSSCTAVYAEQTSDGGYMVIGGSPGDIIVLKTDQNGVQQWNKNYGIARDDRVTCAEPTADDGYVVSGLKSLLKVDSAGDMQWNRTLTQGKILCVRRASDGGYILVGNAGTILFGDPVLVKTNQSGGIQWNTTYGGFEDPSAGSVQPTPDGGYMIVGQANWHGLLIKVDSNGRALWNRTYQDEGWSRQSSIQQTSDGGYVMIGYTLTTYDWMHFWLVKTDSNGNLEWKKTLSQNSDWHYRCSIQQTSDGDYVISGTTIKAGSYQDGDTDVWIGKVVGQISPVKWVTVIGWSAAMVLMAIASIALICIGIARARIKNQ
jgi:hypothetical protein